MRFNDAPVAIVRQLVHNGFEAYIVGGAVRDMLLEKQPKDYDITTNATPEEVRRVFGRRKCRLIGKRFRLALVFWDGETYEVSTFRKEPNHIERRGRPTDKGEMIWNDNVFGTLEDDVRRRDFTANALYYDVNTDEIIDMINGMEDIKTRVVRCIGAPATRFMEDPVRMLRALKLVGQHQFTMRENIRKAIVEKAALIQEASPARLFEELQKILNTDSALPIFEACQENGFLKYFCPMLSTLWETPGGELIRALLKQHDDCIDHEKNYFKEKSLPMSLMALPYLLSVIDMDEVSRHVNVVANQDACAKAIHTFFLTFNMPKEMLYDIRDIVMLLPEMAALHNLDKVRNNLVYPLAYEVFRLLTMANGWMADAFAELPLPNDVSQWQEQATREIEEDSLQTQQPKRPRRRRRPAKRKKTAAETPVQPTNDTSDTTDNE